MKDLTAYIFLVGVAFYGGMQMPQKTITKTVVKTVVKKDAALQTMFNACHRAQKECVERYDELVEKANDEVKNLKSENDICQERYRDYAPHENLKPEAVSEEEPQLGVYGN